MTTLNSALASRLPAIRALALAALAAIAVGACESAPSLLNGGGEAPNVALTPAAPAPGTSQSAKIQIAPIIGSPENVARDIATQLAASIEKRGVSVAKTAGASGEYVLRGYIVAAREKTGSKVSYIWDVTDQQGRRVHRVTGEEQAGGTGKDPWSSVTPQIVQAIADRTAAQIAQWIPSAQASTPVAAATPAASATPATAAGGATQVASNATPQQSIAAPSATPAAPQPTAPTTGSIQHNGPITTTVPAITGAPGDGGTSLTAAIQRELTRNGVALTPTPTGASYKVEGKVVMGQAKDGKQSIQIDWNVIDPTGKKLGTVSQKNDVPQGSLDGAWGKTAEAAAQAAAAGIIKLLPQKTAAN